MSNITIMNVDLGNVILKDATHKDEVLVFGAAGTESEGTILARQEVAEAITPTADAGNTGDGTVTLAAVVTGPIVPLVGNYTLECIAAVTNGGTFKLEDPNGALVANNLVMTAGAGTATAFVAAGMTFTITDGTTDFVVGDKFALAVAADGKLVPFSLTGVGGAQVPKAVLTYDVTAAGAGNVVIRAMIAGHVRKERLIVKGSAAGVGITDAIQDQLRDFTIVASDVQELNVLDNQ